MEGASFSLPGASGGFLGRKYGPLAGMGVLSELWTGHMIRDLLGVRAEEPTKDRPQEAEGGELRSFSFLDKPQKSSSFCCGCRIVSPVDRWSSLITATALALKACAVNYVN